ncbi:MAG: elongation factor P [Gammaproteobacteria bacterium]|nr:elongation factor P [Gammaproteobacteria bacterium]MDH3468009.1 elongation factor P [Gammaproteobacteria bacterium]
MKVSAFDIKIGNLIEYQGKLWRILKKNHVKPGKGGAFVQLEMKEISNGTKRNDRFRSEDKIEKAHVEPRKMQYLYADGDQLVFMDSATYEQISIAADDLAAVAGFLLPNTDVQINFHNSDPIGVELPDNVVLEVVDTEGVIKGQTASGSNKPAEMETGIRVSVPTFINIGDRIRVNTETGEYVERAD